MNKRSFLHAGLACLALLAAPITHAAQPIWAGPPPWAGSPGGPVTKNYKHLYAFGDSLSDTGNALILTSWQGFAPPVPPSATPHRSYYDGRFSNGPVAFEHMWRMMKGDNTWMVPSLAADPTPEMTNAISYAYGGTGTGPAVVTPGGFLAPGLQTQIDIFAAALQDRPAPSNALYAIWAGANDYLFFGLRDPSFAVDNIAAAIRKLYALGARDFIVPNLPDMSVAPLVQWSGPQFPPLVSQLVLAHNAMLAQTLQGLSAELGGATIVPVDTYAVMQHHLQLGTVQLGAPALELLAPGSSVCLYFNPGGCPDVNLAAPLPPLVFWDALHPTSFSHELIARAMIEALAKQN